MGTETFTAFRSDGTAYKLKGRILRHLDNDPVTDADKSNIRSTLGITSQGGLGDLLAANNLDDVASKDTAKTNLEIGNIGTSANEIPLCGFLGGGAFRENDCIVTEHTSVGTDAGGVAVNFYANNATLHCVKNGPVVSVTGRLMVQTTSAANQMRFTLPYVVGDFGNSSGNGFASVGIIDSSAGTYTAGYATFSEGNDYVQVRHTPEANDEFYISFTYHTNA